MSYPWYASFVIIMLILVPLIVIPGYAIYKWIMTRKSKTENEGILCGKKWTLKNMIADISFWNNKYDASGELTRSEGELEQ